MAAGRWPAECHRSGPIESSSAQPGAARVTRAATIQQAAAAAGQGGEFLRRRRRRYKAAQSEFRLLLCRTLGPERQELGLTCRFCRPAVAGKGCSEAPGPRAQILAPEGRRPSTKRRPGRVNAPDPHATAFSAALWRAGFRVRVRWGSPKAGLYALQRTSTTACGVGFVAQYQGPQSHEIVSAGRAILSNLDIGGRWAQTRWWRTPPAV